MLRIGEALVRGWHQCSGRVDAPRATLPPSPLSPLRRSKLNQRHPAALCGWSRGAHLAGRLAFALACAFAMDQRSSRPSRPSACPVPFLSRLSPPCRARSCLPSFNLPAYSDSPASERSFSAFIPHQKPGKLDTPRLHSAHPSYLRSLLASWPAQPVLSSPSSHHPIIHPRQPIVSSFPPPHQHSCSFDVAIHRIPSARTCCRHHSRCSDLSLPPGPRANLEAWTAPLYFPGSFPVSALPDRR